MKVRRANKLMMARHPGDLSSRGARLPDRLWEILNSGLTEREDCVFLTRMLEKCESVRRNDFPDKTGYECFVNLVHIDDFVESDMVAVGLAFLGRISAMLESKYHAHDFRGLLSEGDSGLSIRFHRVRFGEEWLSGNLETYRECVCEFEL